MHIVVIWIPQIYFQATGFAYQETDGLVHLKQFYNLRCKSKIGNDVSVSVRHVRLLRAANIVVKNFISGPRRADFSKELTKQRANQCE